MDHTAELIELQARVADLQTSLERVREERDAARSTAALLEDECAEKSIIIQEYDKDLRDLQVQVARLRLHIQQGVEL